MSDPLDQAEPKRWYDRAVLAYALVAAVAGAIVFWQLDLTILDEHEAKAALAERGIVRQDAWLVQGAIEEPLPEPTPLNRWLIPINNGRPRLVKTPLPYWVAVALALPKGDVDELAARLPSALSAVLCALATLAIGRRMLSPRAALMGALAFATSVGFQKWGRDARPEMLLCLFMTVAMGCFYMGLNARGRLGRAAWMLAFWAAMGLANLCKEFFPLLLAVPLAAYLCWRASDTTANAQDADPENASAPARPRRLLAAYGLVALAGIGLAIVITGLMTPARWRSLGLSDTTGNIAVMGLLVLLPLLGYALAARPWRTIGRLLATAIPGAILMFALFLPWLWYMHRLFHAEDVFTEQVAERAAGTGIWSAAGAFYYLKPLVELTLPWVAFLPGALAAAWMKRFAGRRCGLVYLFMWSAGLLAMVTLAAGKRPHYVLPIVPAVCLLAGFVAEDVFFRHRWIQAGLARVIAIGYGAVGLAAPLVVGGLLVISLDPSRWRWLLKSTRLGASFPSPAAWTHMLIVALLVAAVMLGLLVLAIRRRLRGAFALIVLAATVLYVGFYTGGDLWDDRTAFCEFARQAADLVPQDAPVYSWGDPQAKTLFYFGRYAPNIEWTRVRLTRQDPKLWDQWIRDREKVAWILGYRHFEDDIAPYGFQVCLEHVVGPMKGADQEDAKAVSDQGTDIVLTLMRRPA